MAEENKDQERTEQPSQRKRDEAKKKGQVARSQEVPSVAVLLGCVTLFYFLAPSMMEQVAGIMRDILENCGQFSFTADSVYKLSMSLIARVFTLLLPLFAVVTGVAVLANYVQIGAVFSSEPIRPDLSKIDPIKGFGRLFSLRSLAELVKNLCKIAIIGLVVYLVLKGQVEDLILLEHNSTGGILAYAGSVALKIIFRSCLVLVMLAILDYAFQRWEFEKGLKMSKQELKDEHKQTEGDPLIKARIRRLQRDAAKRRMMANVPGADVIVTNPTHLAVALKYDQDTMKAPKVMAKGSGYIAEKIKEIGRINGVAIVENKPLARVLYKMVDIDDMIPASLYEAVAEVLAYVYGLNSKGRTAR